MYSVAAPFSVCKQLVVVVVGQEYADGQIVSERVQPHLFGEGQLFQLEHFGVRRIHVLHLLSSLQMLLSLAAHLEPLPAGEGEQFLTHIQSLFLSDFISKQQFSDTEEEKPLNISSKPGHSDEMAFDQLICQDGPQEGGGDSESDSSTVLHLGSVLSTGHDYLL